MRVRSVRHKGLKRLIEDDDDRAIRPDLVNRVRRILTALLSTQGIEGLEGPPGWRIHRLTGDRAEPGAFRFPGTGGSPSTSRTKP
jgi:toxin HigB-1